MVKYANLDGVEAESNQEFEDYLRSIGYTIVVPLRGEVGATELAMWTRNVERIGIVALVYEKHVHCDELNGTMGGYANVLMDNGKFLEGCFHRFRDGHFSVS